MCVRHTCNICTYNHSKQQMIINKTHTDVRIKMSTLLHSMYPYFHVGSYCTEWKQSTANLMSWKYRLHLFEPFEFCNMYIITTWYLIVRTPLVNITNIEWPRLYYFGKRFVQNNYFGDCYIRRSEFHICSFHSEQVNGL